MAEEIIITNADTNPDTINQNNAGNIPDNQNQQQNKSSNNPDTAPAQTPVNYEELYKTDKALQSFVDKTTTKSNQTAVQNALEKQKRITDQTLSESERLKDRTADERAKYFEQKCKDLENAYVRDKEIESLKMQTETMLTESSIPSVFIDVFDFNNATAEDIKQRVAMLSEYEYYPKGELEKRVKSALDDKLKQKTPEIQNPSNNQSDPFLKGFNG